MTKSFSQSEHIIYRYILPKKIIEITDDEEKILVKVFFKFKFINIFILYLYLYLNILKIYILIFIFIERSWKEKIKIIAYS